MNDIFAPVIPYFSHRFHPRKNAIHMFDFKQILSVSLILFSVIDIIGNIPIIIELREKSGTINSGKATIVAGILMILFLYFGEGLLSLFGIDVQSFAIAGGFILFLIGLQMVLERNIFNPKVSDDSSSSIVPLAFPFLAGPGTMTTIVSLRAEFDHNNILIGVIVNLILIYTVLKISVRLERTIGKSGIAVIRKIFGIILLAIAIKLIKTNLL